MTYNLNEAETRAELIDPLIKVAGWGVIDGSRVERESIIGQGRLQGAGTRSKKEIADYVLVYHNQKLAVIEAKRTSLSVTEGLGQAKNYAEKLQARFAYSTNGLGIYRVDMETGEEGEVDSYPTPQELWKTVFGEKESREQYWRDRFSTVSFETKGGQWQARYYQHNAITNVLEALANDNDRILLTLATGTGKTAIAFQIAWKLFYSRWNLKDWKKSIPEGEEPTRRPRILFLADRNILADQAYNAFSAFPEDALVRIAPSSIRKKGRVPKNGSIFFTIFQTFMSGTDENGEPKAYFGEYPPDFFDLIVIDECHRGGANDESNWRSVMNYFKPAVQLGLTATPRRKLNADTYAYFGEPVYVYSLKEGINDGYLTPFKVKQVSTTIDEYMYTADDMIVQGEIEEDKRYTEPDFNRIIEIKAREKIRVKIFMEDMDQKDKTLVFCASQAHALIVRDLVNQMKTSKDPNYCVRVTANDGNLGEQFLRTFQDNEKTIPTILTTSHKLSTGVDARNIRNIVLMRTINSMIEFKQIIGRGTRLFDGKDYFTIYDFVKGYHHFSDPEWDGEPEEPVVIDEDPSSNTQVHQTPLVYDDDKKRKRKKRTIVRLADGKERTIQHMMATSFWSPDGKPMSANEFVERLYGDIPELFNDEDELRRLWSSPDTRRKLLAGLEEKGYGREQLKDLSKMIDAENSDLYDVLAYIAYAAAPMTRKERVDTHRSLIYTACSSKQREFLAFVLDQYISEGVDELDDEKLPDLIELKYHALADAVEELGKVATIRQMFIGFQKQLYQPSNQIGQ